MPDTVVPTGWSRSRSTRGLLVGLWVVVGVPSPLPAHGAARLALEPCHLSGLAEQVSCGRFEVSEDRTANGGRRLSLAVAVLPALTRRVEPDPLVILAGGPGQGARSYAPHVNRTFREVRRHRDIVLVDLRGTGDSGPLRCEAPEDDLASLDGAAAPPIDAERCLSALAADVRHYTNREMAADLDQVREALGYERINLWGGSFGTRTALVYARRFPERVRAAVLDGAAPFEVRFPLHVAEDSEGALEKLFQACDEEAACRKAFPDLRGEFGRLLSRFAGAKVRVEIRHPRTGRPRTIAVDAGTFATVLRGLLYVPDHASLVPHIVFEAARGNYAPFVGMALETTAWSADTMALGLTLSVVCSEDVSRVPYEEGRRLSVGTFVGSSFFDAWKTMCGTWRTGSVPDRVDQVVALKVPALILSGAFDPVTPPRWGEAMARHFANARHVVVPGAAHNTSFTGCVPELIASFLSRGGADGLDTTCVEKRKRPPFVLGGTGAMP